MRADTPTLERERAARPSPVRAWAIAVLGGLLVVGGMARFLLVRPEAVPVPTDTLSTAEEIASWERALAANPVNLSGWQQLGVILLQAATETGNPAYYSRSEEALAEAAALDPGNPTTDGTSAALALARHDFETAADLARELVAKDDFNWQGHLVLVDASIELGEYDAAANHLQSLLDIRPALPALSRMSYLRELHGDLPGAEEAMVQAITAGSGSLFDIAVTTTLLGDLYLKQGELDRAEQRYLEAQELSPTLVTAALGRARVAIAQGDLERAAAILSEVVDRFPEPGALTLLGEVLTEQGRSEEAVEAFQTVELVAQLQKDAGAVVDLEYARFLADHGDAGEALALATVAYESRPTIHAASTLAWSLYRSGLIAEAAGYATESLRLGTLEAQLLLGAAQVLEANGDSELAAELRAQAVGVDPWYHVIAPLDP